MALAFLMILMALGPGLLLVLLINFLIFLVSLIRRKVKPGSVSDEDYEGYKRILIVTLVLVLLTAAAYALCRHALSGTTMSM